MQRRKFLAGTGSAVTIGLAGCLGLTGSSAEPANEYNYETTSTRGGPDVPLVPVADAIDWFEDEDTETVFVDARDETGFNNARIEGSVFSPAPDGLDSDDPLSEYGTDTRIVTYCVCPHRLAAMRGGDLIDNGYAHTYALDEGLEGWYERGYPMEGDTVEERPAVYEIVGETSEENAGELAWTRHEQTGQREAATIDEDGLFTLHVRFHDITLDSELVVETPAEAISGDLKTLTETTLQL